MNVLIYSLHENKDISICNMEEDIKARNYFKLCNKKVSVMFDN